MTFITNSDLIGKFSTITNGFNTEDLSLYIDREDPIRLVEMLGKELFDLWKAGVELLVPDPIYLKLKDPFIFQSSCGKVYESKGIVDMLCGFVYFHYQAEKQVTQTINAAVKVKSTNSTPAGHDFIYSRYNDSILTYQAIQAYCLENSDVYPEFKGTEKMFIDPVLM